MSINFAGIATLPYIGAYFKKPVALWPGELPMQGNKGKSSAPVNIIWNTYWQALSNPVSVGVQLNFSLNNASGALIDKIRSVKIDNTGSTVPIYIIFPDTLDVITCPPQTVVVETVISDSLNPIVYATGLTAGFIPTTLIQFLNFCMTPTVDPAIQISYPQWLGSTTIQRGNILTPGYGPPALGDQTENISFHYPNTQQVPVLNTPRASGFIILTGLNIDMSSINSTANTGVSLTIASAVSGTLFFWQFLTHPAVLNNEDKKVCGPWSGMNLRLDATESFTMTLNQGGFLSSADILGNFIFSYQP